jgi:hypothetical protein
MNAGLGCNSPLDQGLHEGKLRIDAMLIAVRERPVKSFTLQELGQSLKAVCLQFSDFRNI